MRFSRRIIFLGISALTILLWIPQQLKLAETRHSTRELEAQLGQISQNVAITQAELAARRNHLQSKLAARDQVILSITKVQGELAAVDPEGRWVAPPAVLPEWNPESPYVWLRAYPNRGTCC